MILDRLSSGTINEKYRMSFKRKEIEVDQLILLDKKETYNPD